MAHINITEQVHVDIRVDGETISEDFTAGVVEVIQPVADLLVAQGIAHFAMAADAEVPSAKPAKKTSSASAAVADTNTTTESTEA